MVQQQFPSPRVPDFTSFVSNLFEPIIPRGTAQRIGEALPTPLRGAYRQNLVPGLGLIDQGLERLKEVPTFKRAAEIIDPLVPDEVTFEGVINEITELTSPFEIALLAGTAGVGNRVSAALRASNKAKLLTRPAAAIIEPVVKTNATGVSGFSKRFAGEAAIGLGAVPVAKGVASAAVEAGLPVPFQVGAALAGGLLGGGVVFKGINKYNRSYGNKVLRDAEQLEQVNNNPKDVPGSNQLSLEEISFARNAVTPEQQNAAAFDFTLGALSDQPIANPVRRTSQELQQAGESGAITYADINIPPSDLGLPGDLFTVIDEPRLILQEGILRRSPSEFNLQRADNVRRSLESIRDFKEQRGINRIGETEPSLARFNPSENTINAKIRGKEITKKVENIDDYIDGVGEVLNISQASRQTTKEVFSPLLKFLASSLGLGEQEYIKFAIRGISDQVDPKNVDLNSPYGMGRTVTHPVGSLSQVIDGNILRYADPMPRFASTIQLFQKGIDEVDDLATLIHEFAHATLPDVFRALPQQEFDDLSVAIKNQIIQKRKLLEDPITNQGDLDKLDLMNFRNWDNIYTFKYASKPNVNFVTDVHEAFADLFSYWGLQKVTDPNFISKYDNIFIQLAKTLKALFDKVFRKENIAVDLSGVTDEVLESAYDDFKIVLDNIVEGNIMPQLFGSSREIITQQPATIISTLINADLNSDLPTQVLRTKANDLFEYALNYFNKDAINADNFAGMRNFETIDVQKTIEINSAKIPNMETKLLSSISKPFAEQILENPNNKSAINRLLQLENTSGTDEIVRQAVQIDNDSPIIIYNSLQTENIRARQNLDMIIENRDNGKILNDLTPDEEVAVRGSAFKYEDGTPALVFHTGFPVSDFFIHSNTPIFDSYLSPGMHLSGDMFATKPFTKASGLNEFNQSIEAFNIAIPESRVLRADNFGVYDNIDPNYRDQAAESLMDKFYNTQLANRYADKELNFDNYIGAPIEKVIQDYNNNVDFIAREYGYSNYKELILKQKEIYAIDNNLDVNLLAKNISTHATVRTVIDLLSDSTAVPLRYILPEDNKIIKDLMRVNDLFETQFPSRRLSSNPYDYYPADNYVRTTYGNVLFGDNDFRLHDAYITAFTKLSDEQLGDTKFISATQKYPLQTKAIQKERESNIAALEIAKAAEWFIVKEFSQRIDRSLDLNLVVDPIVARTANTNEQFISQSLLLKKNSYFIEDIVQSYKNNRVKFSKGNKKLDGLNKLYQDSGVDAITWLAGQQNTNGIHRQIILVGDDVNINKNFVRRTENPNRKNELSFSRNNNTRKSFETQDGRKILRDLNKGAKGKNTSKKLIDDKNIEQTVTSLGQTIINLIRRLTGIFKGFDSEDAYINETLTYHSANKEIPAILQGIVPRTVKQVRESGDSKLFNNGEITPEGFFVIGSEVVKRLPALIDQAAVLIKRNEKDLTEFRKGQAKKIGKGLRSSEDPVIQAKNAYGGARGQFAKLGFEPLDMSYEEFKGLLAYANRFTITKTGNIRSFDHLNILSALQKITGIKLSDIDEFGPIGVDKLEETLDIAGEALTRTEANALARVFGLDDAAIAAVKRQRQLDKFTNMSLRQKLTTALVEILNIPRMLVLGGDLGSVFNQGLLFSGNPVKYVNDIAKSMKTFYSSTNYNRAMANIYKDPDFSRFTTPSDYRAINPITNVDEGTGYGLYIADPDSPLSLREEAFISNWIKKVPGVGNLIKAGERFHTAFLNTIRYRLTKDYYNILKNSGDSKEIINDKMKKYVRFVNAGTGRGDLGGLQKIAGELNAVALAPRWVASRFQVPVLFFNEVIRNSRSDTSIASKMAKDMIGFASVVTGIGSLLVLNGFNVEMDSRKSNFLKLKKDNINIDLTAGMGPVLRLINRVVHNTAPNGELLSQTGQPYQTETTEIIVNFLGTKLSPGARSIVSLTTGQDFYGDEITSAADAFIPTDVESIQEFAPLFIQEITELARLEGQNAALALALPAFMGMNMSVYPNKNTVAQSEFRRQYNELWEFEQDYTDILYYNASRFAPNEYTEQVASLHSDFQDTMMIILANPKLNRSEKSREIRNAHSRMKTIKRGINLATFGVPSRDEFVISETDPLREFKLASKGYYDYQQSIYDKATFDGDYDRAENLLARYLNRLTPEEREFILANKYTTPFPLEFFQLNTNFTREVAMSFRIQQKITKLHMGNISPTDPSRFDEVRELQREVGGTTYQQTVANR